jgi:hypothetical protein
VSVPKVVELDGTPPSPTAEGVVVPTPDERDQATLTEKVKTLLIGKPRDLADTSMQHRLSLIAFLAWVGLGADPLSSSCYGPEEAFKNLIHPEHGDHTYLAFFLAIAVVGTVWVISACYRHIIEEFPSGGGGYLVATKLLGRKTGVISGSALVVDYVLTITVSIAAAGDALFGLIDPAWAHWKMPCEFAAIVVLIILNLRGVRESVTVLKPIFLLFLVTHFVLIVGSIGLNVTAAGDVVDHVSTGIKTSMNDPQLGFWFLLAMLLRAYSFGAGTYTGIEAVSNSMPVLREPVVETGKRTMVYMAFSLAFTAGGLVIAFLLMKIIPEEGKTMNQALSEGFVEGLVNHWAWLRLPGWWFVVLTMIAEGTLLIVAAQAGFIDGPRVLANMARDSWVPHWFGNLSERLATHNGVLLMGVSALAALIYTGGNVTTLVIMYSINVFVTFSLSLIGMCRHWWQERHENPIWRRRLALFVLGATLCVSIFVMNVVEKFMLGGWITLAITLVCVILCLLINRYYREVLLKLRRLNEILDQLPTTEKPNLSEPDPNKPTAAILVGGYGGLGIHTFLNAIKFAPEKFNNVLFLSIGVIDSGNFKGARAVDDLRKHTHDGLERFVDLARSNGLAAKAFMAIDTDAVDGLEQLCVAVSKQFPRVIFFAGQLVFQKDTWVHRLLHNETAFSLQRRLHWAGLPIVILPTRVR